MIAALTGIGLSAAAGLNAYIPFLIVALIAKYTDVITLPASYAWMESWWAIGIGAVLLLTELVLDKVPAVDSINDAVHTFIRPGMGGLLSAATAGATELDNSAWMAQHPWVGVVLGVVVAGLVHAGKATARPVANLSTAGVGAPVVSTVEDGASVGLSLIALFAPLLVIVALLVLAIAFSWLWWRLHAWRRRRRAAEPLPPARGPGPARLREKIALPGHPASASATVTVGESERAERGGASRSPAQARQRRHGQTATAPSRDADRPRGHRRRQLGR